MVTAKENERCWYIAQIKPFQDYLRTECGLAANTALAYGHDLQRFAAFCGDLKLEDPEKLTPLQLQNFARFLSEEKLATSSISRYLSSVKMFFRFLILIGTVKKSHCDLMESPKTWQRLPKVLNKKLTVDLVTAIDAKSPMFLRDRTMMELLYATGMRASETVGLILRDFNFQIGYLRCLGKGEKERIIPIHTTAVNYAKDYLKNLRPKLLGEKQETAFFLSRTGRPLNRIEVWRIVLKAAQQAGLTGKVTPHTLRHCFGSHLLAGGADLRSVQEMLGHADVSTTQIYTHVDHEYLRSVHKRFHPKA